MSSKILDVFQEGLIRGSEKLAFDPEKEYFYVQHPTEGWRVYLRSACFLHDMPVASATSIDYTRFLVVKKIGTPEKSHNWEPPKGQMEGKDGVRHPRQSILDLLRTNVQREVMEESYIESLKGLHYTGLAFQQKERDYPPNTFFQYHIFNAFVIKKVWMGAIEKLDWYHDHPKAHARLRRDKREKDRLRWYSPTDTPLSRGWGSNIVTLYLKNMIRY
jgi:hypothetical protein